MLLPVILTFGTAVALSLLALRVFPRAGLLDFPERYGLTRARLPYPMGIVSVVVFLGAFAVLEPLSLRSAGVYAAIVLLALTSFLDDRAQLPVAVRFTMQFIVAGIIFISGDCTGGRICSVTNPLEMLGGGPYIELNGALPIAAVIATVAWLVLTMNALNWFDGIPGQVNALSVIAFATIGALSLSDRVNQPQLAVLAFVLSAIACAGLLFDWPPAKAILGDTGAMFYGLMLGVLTIYAGGKVATAFLVLGVPLVDSIIVIVRRIAEGRSPFRGGRDHLHHRLLERGWKPHAVILFSVILGGGFGITALFLSTTGKFIAGLLLVLIMAGMSAYASNGRRTSAAH